MSDAPYVNLPLPKGLPKAFLFRRLHSIAGAFFILFLCEHMLTNSTSALLIREEGSGFIKAVNFLQSLPYLPFIEFFLLAVPIAIHVLLGILYFFEARWNSFSSDGSTPALTGYMRNHAFTWQRITSLLIVVGVIAHVTTMRFLDRPEEVITPQQTKFAVPVAADPGLISLAPRLHTILITPQSKDILLTTIEHQTKRVGQKLQLNVEPSFLAPRELLKLRLTQYHAFLDTVHPTNTTWTALAPDFGTACLLIVRENFRTPWICVVYTIFVLAASFHAANGLWTFAISWGIPLNEGGRRIIRGVGSALGAALLLGGLASIWLTYWVTLNT
jgi:succinate dehydrogenase / fumarate reductase cytochrome b subunit